MKKLKGIPETMLITLWAKAMETKHKSPIIIDNKAVEMLSKIDYDFSKFKKSWLSQVGVAIRSLIFDNAVKDFLERNQNAIIINLGAGLDTRFERLEKSKILRWYDLDKPEAIKLRRNFFNESEKNKFIEKSMFDFSWIDEIKTENRPVLIILEGVLMYFNKDEIKPVFDKLIKHFPDSEIIFDTISLSLVGKSKYHDSVNKMETNINNSIEFKWGTNNPKTIESWNPKIKFINSWNYYDFCKNRWSWIGIINKIPIIRKNMSCLVVHFKLEK